MLKLERRGVAFNALITLAQKGSVLIYYRGINDKGEMLYEVKTGDDNKIICLNQTEEQVIKSLLKGES